MQSFARGKQHKTRGWGVGWAKGGGAPSANGGKQHKALSRLSAAALPVAGWASSVLRD